MTGAQFWQREVYTSRWSAIFTRYCADKFAWVTDPVQLMEEARQQLSLSLHRKNEKGDSFAPSEGYILVAFKHAVTDVLRKEYGRGEPRAWLKTFGVLGQRLFQLYCLARQRRTAVLEVLENEFSDGPGDKVTRQAKELLNEMDRRQECQGKSMKKTSLESNDDESSQIAGHGDPETDLQVTQAQALRAYLFREPGSSLEAVGHLVEKIESMVDGLPDTCTLDDQQRFIVHATLTGELTEQQIGRLLELSVRQVRYKRKKSLEVVGKIIRKIGLDLADLLDESTAPAYVAETGQGEL